MAEDKTKRGAEFKVCEIACRKLEDLGYKIEAPAETRPKNESKEKLSKKKSQSLLVVDPIELLYKGITKKMSFFLCISIIIKNCQIHDYFMKNGFKFSL